MNLDHLSQLPLKFIHALVIKCVDFLKRRFRKWMIRINETDSFVKV